MTTRVAERIRWGLVVVGIGVLVACNQPKATTPPPPAAAAAAPAAEPPLQPRVERNPDRNAYFGESTSTPAGRWMPG